MKTMLKLTTLALLITLSGCSNFFEPPAQAPEGNEQAPGTLRVRFNMAGDNARTILPDLSNITPHHYEIQFEPDAGNGNNNSAPPLVNTMDSPYYDIALPYGRWFITVAAFDGSNNEIGLGTYKSGGVKASFDYSPSGTKTLTVYLDPVDDQGDGTFKWNIDASAFLSGGLEGGIKIYRRNPGDGNKWTLPVNMGMASGGDVPGTTQANSGNPTIASSIGLSPGFYRVEYLLSDGWQSIGIVDVLHIYSNIETTLERTYGTNPGDIALPTIVPVRDFNITINSGWSALLEKNEYELQILYPNGIFFTSFPVTDGGTTGTIAKKLPKNLFAADAKFLVRKKSDNTFYGLTSGTIDLNNDTAINATLAISPVSLTTTVTASGRYATGLVGNNTGVNGFKFDLDIGGSWFVDAVSVNDTVSDWLTNKPAGVTAKISAIGVDKRQVTIELSANSSNPSEYKVAPIGVTVPSGKLIGLPALPLTAVSSVEYDIQYKVDSALSSTDGSWTISKFDGSVWNIGADRAIPGETLRINLTSSGFDKRASQVSYKEGTTLSAQSAGTPKEITAADRTAGYVEFVMPVNKHITELKVEFDQVITTTINFAVLNDVTSVPTISSGTFSLDGTGAGSLTITALSADGFTVTDVSLVGGSALIQDRDITSYAGTWGSLNSFTITVAGLRDAVGNPGYITSGEYQIIVGYIKGGKEYSKNILFTISN